MPYCIFVPGNNLHYLIVTTFVVYRTLKPPLCDTGIFATEAWEWNHILVEEETGNERKSQNFFRRFCGANNSNNNRTILVQTFS